MLSMNKTILTIVVVIGIFGTVGLFLLLQQNSKLPDSEGSVLAPITEQMAQTDRANQLTQPPPEVKQFPADQNNEIQYIEYSDTAFEQAKDKNRVLFFYASWCPTCRPADVDFSENMAQIPENVVVFRVNYNDSDTDDSEKTLSERYGITYQHTYVQVDSLGDEVKKWNGGKLSELLQNIQ